jgi:WD40 repeat protein
VIKSNVLVRSRGPRFNNSPHEFPALTFWKFSPDSTKIVGVLGSNIYLTKLHEKKTFTFRQSEPITLVEFGPDGKEFLTASTDETFAERSAQLWDADRCTQIGSRLQHRDGILHAAFSPSGDLVVTTSEDFTASLWDARTGKHRARLSHKERVYSAQFAHRHPWIVTASGDKTAVIWDTRTGNPLMPPLEHKSGVTSAVFTDNDLALATTDKDGNQWRWRLSMENKSAADLAKIASHLSGAEHGGATKIFSLPAKTPRN